MKYMGIDLGGTQVRAGLVNGDRFLQLQAKKIRSQGTSEEVFEDVCEVIEAAWNDQVRGIGIGVPGLVDPKSGRIHDTTNIPSWKNVPLKKSLKRNSAFRFTSITMPIALRSASVFLAQEKTVQILSD